MRKKKDPLHRKRSKGYDRQPDKRTNSWEVEEQVGGEQIDRQPDKRTNGGQIEIREK